MALDYLPTPNWSVVYGEVPSASKWSQLGGNDNSLALGTGIDDLAILARHIALLAVKGKNIDHPTFNWATNKPGITNTNATGGFGFTPLGGGGLTQTFAAVNGVKYLIEVSSSFVAPGSSMQYDLGAQIGSTLIIDNICTNGAATVVGIPMNGRTIYTATSTGNVTVTAGVTTASATTVRTDNVVLSVRQITN